MLVAWASQKKALQLQQGQNCPAPENIPFSITPVCNGASALGWVGKRAKLGPVFTKSWILEVFICLFSAILETKTNSLLKLVETTKEEWMNAFSLAVCVCVSCVSPALAVSFFEYVLILAPSCTLGRCPRVEWTGVEGMLNRQENMFFFRVVVVVVAVAVAVVVVVVVGFVGVVVVVVVNVIVVIVVVVVVVMMMMMMTTMTAMMMMMMMMFLFLWMLPTFVYMGNFDNDYSSPTAEIDLLTFPFAVVLEK